jgi:ribosomal protein S24E
MEIKKDFKNQLMQRREIEGILEFDKNPSFPEVAKIIADEFKSNEDQIMVENAKGTFGKKTFIIRASIYDTKELKDEAVKRLVKAKKEAAPAA